MSKTRYGNQLIENLPEDASLLEQGTRWARVERDILCSDEFRGLSAGARIVYTYLCLFINAKTRSWSIRVGLLAMHCGYSNHHVRRSLAELEQAGLISRRHTWWLHEEGSARQGANLYSLTLPPSLRDASGGVLLPFDDDAEQQPEAPGDSAPVLMQAPPDPSPVVPLAPPPLAAAPLALATEHEASPLLAPAHPGPEASVPTALQSVLEPAPVVALEQPSASAQHLAQHRAPPPAPADPRPSATTAAHTQTNEVARGGGQDCPGKYSPPSTDPRSSSPTPPPTPRPRERGQGSDEGQVTAIVHLFGSCPEAWWNEAEQGTLDRVSEVAGALDALRRSGIAVSRRKRTIPGSIKLARSRLGPIEHRARHEGEDVAQQLEALEALREEHQQRLEQQQQHQRSEQQHQQQHAHVVVEALETLCTELLSMDSPLPGLPSPRPIDAVGLPAPLRRAVFRFHGRRRTADAARALASRLRASPHAPSVLEEARALLARSAA